MTPYEILGVEVTTPIEDIRAAYRRLAAVHHPDKGGDVGAFQRIQRAWAMLKGRTVCPLCQGRKVVQTKVRFGTITMPCPECGDR